MADEATTLARGETAPHTVALWSCERELQAKLLYPTLGADLLRLVRVLRYWIKDLGIKSLTSTSVEPGWIHLPSLF